MTTIRSILLKLWRRTLLVIFVVDYFPMESLWHDIGTRIRMKGNDFFATFATVDSIRKPIWNSIYVFTQKNGSKFSFLLELNFWSIVEFQAVQMRSVSQIIFPCLRIKLPSKGSFWRTVNDISTIYIGECFFRIPFVFPVHTHAHFARNDTLIQQI